MRCFIALSPDDHTRRRIAEIRDKAASIDIGARPVLEDNIHLTMVFIGDIPPEKAREIARALKILPKLEDKYWMIDRSGCFPRSKVCWVGGASNPYLSMYSEQCRKILDAMGVTYDTKGFRPHVTILKQSRLEAPLVLEPIRWKIGVPQLFESSRDSKGILRYTPLA